MNIVQHALNQFLYLCTIRSVFVQTATYLRKLVLTSTYLCKLVCAESAPRTRVYLHLQYTTTHETLPLLSGECLSRQLFNSYACRKSRKVVDLHWTAANLFGLASFLQVWNHRLDSSMALWRWSNLPKRSVCGRNFLYEIAPGLTSDFLNANPHVRAKSLTLYRPRLER
ncbi:hypothetical protein EVAR_7910_1 [Eumeta japonica]|uniref:Uncharacterized protein n=1 Tax=Eumeta variegata TaxID=151549 RepID=A0A4C1TV81_EUMVA|nr:hypothetical protein EVAR_7910_1 [Eumeta japonica]